MAAIAVAKETTAKADHKRLLARAGQTTRQRGKITGTQILPVWRHHARDTLDPAIETHLTGASRRQVIKGTQRIEALAHVAEWPLPVLAPDLLHPLRAVRQGQHH